MMSDRAFIFHIFIPWGKTLSLVPKSRSAVPVKVKNQGQFSNKRPLQGIRVSQTQLLQQFCLLNSTLLKKKKKCTILARFKLSANAFNFDKAKILASFFQF